MKIPPGISHPLARAASAGGSRSSPTSSSIVRWRSALEMTTLARTSWVSPRDTVRTPTARPFSMRTDSTPRFRWIVPPAASTASASRSATAWPPPLG